MNNKDLVVTSLAKLFEHREAAAIDEYFTQDFVQHSTLAGNGLEGLRDFIGNLPEDFRYQPVRVLGEGDLVVLHGTYFGLGPEPLVAFDVFRIADGRIAEQWQALQPEITQTASGRSMTDGPAEVTEPDKTAQNKAIVERFVDEVLVRGELSGLTGYFDGDNYAQHNPHIGDNLSGLGTAIQAMAQQGVAMTYSRVHRTVADGEFVFVQSEGAFGSAPTAFYDLFRVEDEKIAEHWDVVFTIPETLPHTNGLF